MVLCLPLHRSRWEPGVNGHVPRDGKNWKARKTRKEMTQTKVGARTLSPVSQQIDTLGLSDCDETSSTRPVQFILFVHWHGKGQFFFGLEVGKDIHVSHLNGSWWLQVHGESCSKGRVSITASPCTGYWSRAAVDMVAVMWLVLRLFK
jgi:hypothetical protein